MIFLSKISLNLRHPAARRDLADPYQLHRTLMRAFPNRSEGGTGRVLFRVEQPTENLDPFVLVQSDKSPDWAYLFTDGYAAADGPKLLDPALNAGDRLRFRLRANPTVKREGKRLGILGEEGQLAWLSRKGEAGGFRPLAVHVARTNKSISHKRLAEQPTVQTHHSVDFEGFLQVTDPRTFAATLAAGIGPAKGFGFGLLSIARA